jgi:hypothetical protein
MKVSIKWLRRHLDLRANYEELGEFFTNIGLEVEGMEHIGVVTQKRLSWKKF